jgi:NH3-dependent NAD+ synthetase
MPRSNASFLGQLLGTSQKITASALDDSVVASLSGGGGVDSAQVALIVVDAINTNEAVGNAIKQSAIIINAAIDN